jgi:outer membrane protein insertion porin family
MKRSLSVIAIVLFAVAAFAQQAEVDWFWGKPIAAIQWDGVQHADRKELDAIVRSFVGKTLTEEAFSALQAQVYALDWFDSIEPAAFPADEGKTKVIIKFTVKEKPSVTSLRLSGNAGLRTTEVLDAVTEKVGDIFNPAKVQLDELAIRKLYLEKGYPDAKVSSSTTAAADGGIVITFFVIEGTQVAIRVIHFTGNAAFTEKLLKSKIELKEAGFLQPGAFQESKLETDRQKIVDYYRQRGYVDAAVVDVIRSASPDPKTGKSGLSLTFVVSEGKQWKYGGITFKGNRVFPTDKLASFFTQKPGDVINYSRLLQEKARLDDLYYENGYIFNNLQLSESRDAEKQSLSYEVNIVERDRAHIESLTIKGNTKTKDYVIAREMPLEVGDIFSKAKIIEGLRNLYNLQYFSSVEPQMMPGSDENLMDLVLAVEEQSTADIQFGVTLSGLGTASDSFPISGNIKWNERNFLGTGRTLGVELNGSPTDQDVTLSYLDNWLFGKRISGGLNFSFQHKHLTTAQDLLYPRFDDGVPDPYNSLAEYEAATATLSDAYKMYYEYWAVTAGASGGYREHTVAGDLGFGGGLTSTLYNNSYDETKYRPASRDIREVANQWLWTNKIPLRAYLNNLDLWYNPSKGYYLSEKLTWAGILTSVEAQRYIRTDTKAEAYLTLFDIPVFSGWNLKWILGVHSAFSAILPQPGTTLAVVSPSDDLRIDGTFTARGWSSLYSVDDGRTLWDNWLELRMPILDQYIWLDGFLDADVFGTSSGLLSIGSASASVDTSKTSFAQMDWNNLVMSMGFGLRFTIPQFPFRLYFAKRFSYDGSGINWKPAGSSGGLDFVISMSQALN